MNTSLIVFAIGALVFGLFGVLLNWVRLLRSSNALTLAREQEIADAYVYLLGIDCPPELPGQLVLAHSRAADIEPSFEVRTRASVRVLLGPVAAAEVQRIELELAGARLSGYEAVLIGEFEYGTHSRLGYVELHPAHSVLGGDRGVSYQGPIHQIVAYLRQRGVRVQVQSELRYANHSRGGGLAYQVWAVVP